MQCTDQGFLTWAAWTPRGSVDGFQGIQEDQIKLTCMLVFFFLLCMYEIINLNRKVHYAHCMQSRLYVNNSGERGPWFLLDS